jgi:predicted Zn-dependent protease
VRDRRGPRSLLATVDEGVPLLTREETLALGQQVIGYMTAPDSAIAIRASAPGNTEFALGEVQGGSDSASHSVSFAEEFDLLAASMDTDEMDTGSLKAAVAKAEALAKAETVKRMPHGPPDPPRPAPVVNPAIWSDRSLPLVAPEARLAAVETSLAAAARASVVPAGRISVFPQMLGVLTKAGHFEYGRTSTCRYSVSARTRDGTGSGWAAWVGEDWSAAQPDALVARAIDLAARSKNAVAIEPGRYTVVMTPEACGELVHRIAFFLDGRMADLGMTPFSKPGGGNKLGMRVLDERVTLSADPMDPEGGFLPFAYLGGLVQYVPVTWVEKGVLQMLSYPTRTEASLHGIDQVNNPLALRMSGGTMSIEDMIAATTRGVYVTRFSDVSVVAPKTLYMTGATRDGTFLIEHGKITKAIKNFRFEDSPFFFLNNLQGLGVPKRVAVGASSYVMPPIMVQDFSFTSLTDSV